ncbi:RNA binding protein-like protein Jsn1 [Dothidotthia symphoricarpi CBS 119687]|uniref:RNA binding protein-like protein Jsn1 n=1 Tax=Dothidotthia symphoricarpi CBS 119687 TaxID=1392245 RepID=A0A6A6A4Q4_9PLEO|nr:RNA binding protein-like protein Jsn1 [Dothidotthia symphoricarpi CBS 119687]KAF2126104.1 RNA binding protein-like protein Jsn1 [Dothidotthia symphoricarpi CBS 119687]
MAPSTRPDHINLNYIPQLNPQPPHSGTSTGTTSPIEPPSGNSIRFPTNSSNPLGSAPGARMNTGSPSHEFGSRLYSKRAREIQAQEGLTPQLWGPPTSGNSTPLRETIPESPNGDSFPDFNQNMPEAAPAAQTSTRRARAGTLPSRFSPSAAPGGLMSLPSLAPKSSRPTPSTSPFKPGSGTPAERAGFTPGATNAAATSALLSRLRAGSMPQQPGFLPPAASAFGNPIFSSAWASNRQRSSTLQSIASQPSNGPGSPMSSFSRDGLADTDVRTLDYLGLVDTPQPVRATLAPSDIELLLESQRTSNSLLNSNNRIRSYSVNAKEKYAEDEDELQYGYSGAITPAEANALLIQEAIRQHNQDVQAFANYASSARPRARTAGVLDAPGRGMMRSFLPTMSADLTEDAEYNLAEAVKKLHLPSSNLGDEGTLDGPTRSLWLGNIPSSTTVSSLNVIFSTFGSIDSTRVLTHKNCGFVNFENLESAVQAKTQLNGKEIFPGAGPIRIGYAKIPSAAATPGHNGLFPSPSPDPIAKAQAESGSAHNTNANNVRVESANVPLTTPELTDIRGDIVQIVKDLGATDDEQARISAQVEAAIRLNTYIDEIPPVEEPSHTRVHDAPRLREIRKRIDNGSCSKDDIEQIALNMLPEVAELASDYLGNTVVQKLFEFCEEPTKEAMLREIAPHLAKIGIHKNGTWAAQKIIDVSKSPAMQKMVVEALQPYAVSLFLDQFGNYVMQGCLKYQQYNNFIFEVMLSRLWDLAQGRFGARAMRACLESHFATKDQQRMAAATIALHSVQLATNANGALLLTWFLDTCTFPRRRTVLAPRLVPHIVHLCTHKVAYLTVLKIINQRNEPEARDTILQALFFSPNDQVLEDILADQNCGATLIFKVLTTPFFDEQIRADVVQNVRNVLARIKAQPQQGYKRLMDEVGLSTRSGPGHRDHSATRSASKDRMGGSQADSRNFYPPAAAGFDPVGLQRTASMDSNNFDQYAMGGNGPMYMPNMQAMNNQQQLQYQQLLARQGQFYPQMNGFQAPPPGMEAYRNASPGGAPGFNGSPMMQPANLAGQGMGPGMGAPMYQYGMYAPQQQQQQQQQAAGGNQRRGRVSRNASPAPGTPY